MSEKDKIFVLDTNVILHDFRCVYHFEENDVIIPISVLEELDKFKKGNDQINFQAREFMRELDRLSGEDLFNGGVSLGEGKGKLGIETVKKFSEKHADSFKEDSQDHRILAIAEYVKLKNPDKDTILVTQDINLRMKAKALDIFSQDYKTGKVSNIEKIEQSIEVISGVDDALISKLYKADEGVPTDEFKFQQAPVAHQYMILKGDNSSALAHFDPFQNVINRVIKENASGITPRNAEQTFALDALIRPEIKLISLTGKAGTGKTLLALAAALQQRKDFEQIYFHAPLLHWVTRI